MTVVELAVTLGGILLTGGLAWFFFGPKESRCIEWSMTRPHARVRLLAAVALAALVAASCGGSSSRPATTSSGRVTPPLEVGETAPEFALTAADGRRVALGDVTAGRPALFYFSMGPG